MVFNVAPESDKVLAAIRKADRVEEYECRISACDNPVCMCDSVYLELLPLPKETKEDPSRRPHKVTIKLAEKKLDVTGKFGTPRNDLDFSRPFLSALDENDFRLLRERHHLFKYQISENAPVDSIEFDFDYDYVERDGAMYAYNEVLPFGDQMAVTIGGKLYLIRDHFCLLPRCSCQDITLSLVYLDPDDKAKDEYHSVGLDYRKKKWSELDERASSLPLAAVQSAFEEQVPDLYENLRTRHAKIKAIYRHCKKRHFNAKQPASKAQVGRNDPCPCGSGNKYKKCCLGKAK
jgi:uncharacterized protein YchJ